MKRVLPFNTEQITDGIGLILAKHESEQFFQQFKKVRLPHMTQKDELYFDKTQRGEDFTFIESTNVVRMIRLSKHTNTILLKNQKDESFFLTVSDEMLVCADKPTDSMSLLKNQSYIFIRELINEYRCKLHAFLPEDFDYQNHIYQFSYYEDIFDKPK
ncbi:hypothetical protein [Scatolibacter rhodanostii]|uniref:hypothetical protein n=1 Tax=Scatolibacter rhodanostii TaxID=2014781 RepID=UPI000C070B52|nr:hypothetical protein [Scatolibacter rhodanostii]